MPLPPPESVLTALGVPRAAERTYQRVLGQSGREVVSIASSLLQTEAELLADLAPLAERGLVDVRDSRVFVSTPAEAVSRAIAETSRAAAEAHRRLEAISDAVPFLTATNVRPGPGEVLDVLPVDGEISSGGNPVELLTSLIRESSGDLLWLRPDQFRRPREDAMAALVGEIVAKGRRSRAIYPVRAVSEAPETLSLRAEVGEEIRILPDLPTRMFIIGTTHVVLPEPLGFADEPRSLVRQAGWVQAMTHWFELLWDQAVPYAQQSRSEVRSDMRTFLLQQLASGAQDEQIARRLGVSLRTVRRRVADMMTELGAESRFQAGVEAARRGWL
ncbi:helix-turn-helix transcriptional regulator [Nocardioides sp. GY 10127]|uniref:helix-turn-helix transcriptional regulator n=1 Tax=Nocardioides sp. GY 10127 TaxID=2569762 RepID=UPI0010A78767|nr:helix-turn-helix transcriptional regulator [Nocardioides sp. GY 10127]TIC80211.1 helix-turn-helix transcriptional regulator [Nocardioides sp. GY 10127]